MNRPIEIRNGAQEIPVSELVARLADELSGAAALTQDCQLAVGEALGPEVCIDLAERLQRLDELSQHLGELARLLERLAAGAALGVATADLFDGVRLSDLKLRLMGAPPAIAAAGVPEFW